MWKEELRSEGVERRWIVSEGLNSVESLYTKQRHLKLQYRVSEGLNSVERYREAGC